MSFRRVGVCRLRIQPLHRRAQEEQEGDLLLSRLLGGVELDRHEELSREGYSD